MSKEKKQKLWITISETINTGNYNSVKIEAGYSKSYEEPQDPIKMIAEGTDELLATIQKKAKKIRKKNKK